MQKIRSHEWDVGIQGCRINMGRINEGRLYINGMRLPLIKDTVVSLTRNNTELIRALLKYFIFIW